MAPRLARFAPDDDHPTGPEAQAMLAGYFGEFVTYTITSDTSVIHHVIGSTLPSFTGTDQHRIYRIQGDTLTIGASRNTWPCRQLIRVR